MAYAITNPKEPKEKQAGEFLASDSESFYWMQKHLERLFEVAVENRKFLKVVAIFVPRTS